MPRGKYERTEYHRRRIREGMAGSTRERAPHTPERRQRIREGVLRARAVGRGKPDGRQNQDVVELEDRKDV